MEELVGISVMVHPNLTSISSPERGFKLFEQIS